MKSLVNKMKNKKGFTLMEMLIVVAIMVILVAVSVPVFSNKLNDAKKAADSANLQSAKSVAYSAAMLGEKGQGTYYYDAASGTLISGTPAASYDYGELGNHDYITVTIDADGNVTECDWNTAE